MTIFQKIQNSQNKAELYRKKQSQTSQKETIGQYCNAIKNILENLQDLCKPEICQVD